MTTMLKGKPLTLERYTYLQTLVMALTVWFLTRHFYHDDSYISLRYAQSLIDGNGFVFNPGERVEGYTNFLHIIFIAMLGSTGMDLVAASREISFAAFFGLIIICCWYTGQWPWRKDRPADSRSLSGALAISLAGSSLPLLAWCSGGLETNLFAFFLCAGCCLTLHMLQGKGLNDTAVGAGIAFALATLTRPEGLMLFGFSFAFLCAAHLFGRGRYAITGTHLGLMLLCYLVVIVPYSYWRFSYFGDVLPNTYYAKYYGINPALIHASGMFYLIQYLFMPPLLVVFAAVMLVIAAVKTRLNTSVAYLACFALAFCVYIISIGGDHMGYFRFMAPLVPVLALLIYHICLLFIDIGKERMLRDIVASLLFFSVFQAGLIMDKGLSTGALSGRAVSDYVNMKWPKGSTIAINPAGALPYYAYHYRYIDMLGLNDKTIARRVIPELLVDGQRAVGHAKGDGAYVLSRQPDYIIFGMAWGDEEPLFLSDLELSQNPDFSKHYVRQEVYVTPPAGILPELLAAKAEKPRGLAMNEQNMLRFIYYQRKTGGNRHPGP